LVPFGRIPNISVVESFAGAGTIRTFNGGAPVEFSPSLLAAVAPMTTTFSDDAHRELAVVWAAEAAGVARRALRETVEFAKHRHQFGKPIGSFQAVKHHLANAHLAAEFAETAAIWASFEQERTDQAVRQSFSKTMQSLHLSIQVYGGIGFTWEMGSHFYLRHVTSLRELAMGVRVCA